MGEALDIAAATEAWVRMLGAPERPSAEAWAAEQEPGLRRLCAEARRVEIDAGQRRGLERGEAALLVDGLRARVARGRGALDLALGEALGALSLGDRTLRLGYASVGDYARERLGLAGRTAQAMAHLWLRELPLLREAVLRGEVSARKAQPLLRVVCGANEAWWVERARGETVRALEAAVRAERGEDAGEEEAWERICLALAAGERAEVDEALELAGKVLGPGAPRPQRLEALAQEYLGENPGDAGSEGERAGAPREAAASAAPAGLRPPPEREFVSWAVRDWLEAAREALEAETRRWEALGTAAPVAAPRSGEEGSPWALDEELRRLLGMRRRWDELVGHLGLAMSLLGLWRERRLWELPGLREALRAGRLSYEQARLVAGKAAPGTLADWVRRAEGMTCIELRRALENDDERQMCAAGRLALLVPVRVAELLSAAFAAARSRSSTWLTPGQCLLEIARHFTRVWKGVVSRRSTPERRARRRDQHCQVPGCSRGAAHAHHLVPLSQGGTDHPHNLVGLCAAHHLHGVHRGWVRVRGRAPDRLAWELGERPAGVIH